MSQSHPNKRVHFKPPDPDLGKSSKENEQEMTQNKKNKQITVSKTYNDEQNKNVPISKNGYGIQLPSYQYNMDISSLEDE